MQLLRPILVRVLPNLIEIKCVKNLYCPFKSCGDESNILPVADLSDLVLFRFEVCVFVLLGDAGCLFICLRF